MFFYIRTYIKKYFLPNNLWKISSRQQYSTLKSNLKVEKNCANGKACRDEKMKADPRESLFGRHNDIKTI